MDKAPHSRQLTREEYIQAVVNLLMKDPTSNAIVIVKGRAVGFQVAASDDDLINRRGMLEQAIDLQKNMQLIMMLNASAEDEPTEVGNRMMDQLLPKKQGGTN